MNARAAHVGTHVPADTVGSATDARRHIVTMCGRRGLKAFGTILIYDFCISSLLDLLLSGDTSNFVTATEIIKYR